MISITDPVIAAQKTISVGTSGSKASLDTNFGNAQSNFTESYGKPRYTLLSEMTADSTHRLVTDALISTWNAKQDPLSNAAALALITNVGGQPYWDGLPWPGGGWRILVYRCMSIDHLRSRSQ